MLYNKEFYESLVETEGRLKSMVSTLETNYEPIKNTISEFRKQRRDRSKIEFTEEEKEMFSKLNNLLEKFSDLYEQYEEI